MHRLVAVLLAAALGLIAVADVPPGPSVAVAQVAQPREQLFRLRLVEGESRRYAVTGHYWVETDEVSLTGTLEGLVELVVQGLHDDGSATVLAHTLEQHYEVSDPQFETTPQESGDGLLRVAPDGTVLSSEPLDPASSVPASDPRAFPYFFVPVPGGPISVGSAYLRPAALSGAGAAPILTTARIALDEIMTAGGRELGRFTIQAGVPPGTPAPGGDGDITAAIDASGTYLVDAATGWPVSVTAAQEVRAHYYGTVRYDLGVEYSFTLVAESTVGK